MSMESENKHLFPAAALAVLCAVFALCCAAALINMLPFDAGLPEAARLMALDPREFRPEPAERFSYLFSLCAGPFLLYAFYTWWLGYFRRNPTEPLIAKTPVLAMGLGVLWLFAALLGTYRLDAAGALCWCAGFAGAWWLERRAEPETRARALALAAPCGLVFAAALLGAVFMHGLFDVAAMRSDFCWAMHFPAVFHSVWEVFNGRVLLRDVASQYGLYAHFLAPLFKLTGLTVFKFSALMSALAVGAYLFMLAVLRREIGSRARLWWAFALVVFLHYFWGRLSHDEIYYQYVPLRLLFPALGLWLAQRWFYAGTPAAFRLATLACCVGVLWNIDSGAVLLLAWVISVGFARFAGSDDGPKAAAARFGSDCVFIGAAVVFTAMAYAALVRLVYGAWPDYAALFSFSALYYGSGYFMLPMRALDLWNVPALIYAGGLMYAVMVLKKDLRYTPSAAVVFMLAVLGAGLFSYYQGRSHLYNLYAVAWPAWLLAAVAFNRLFGFAVTETGAVLRARALALGCVLSVTGLLVVHAGTLAALSVDKLLVSAYDDRSAAQARFIAANSAPGEDILIFSYRRSVLEMLSGRRETRPRPSLVELVRRSDIDRLSAELCSPSVSAVFVDFETDQYSTELPKVTEKTRSCRTIKYCERGMCLFK